MTPEAKKKLDTILALVEKRKEIESELVALLGGGAPAQASTAVKQTAKRVCGRCGEPGHRRDSCTNTVIPQIKKGGMVNKAEERKTPMHELEKYFGQVRQLRSEGMSLSDIGKRLPHLSRGDLETIVNSGKTHPQLSPANI